MTREEVITESWHRGRASRAILTPAQLKMKGVFDARFHKLCSFECSRQLGKTFTGFTIADEVARTCPEAQIRIGTAFEVDIEGIIVPNSKRVLETCPEEIKPKYTRKVFHYHNGSKIILVGLDKNPDKMRGPRNRLALIEEAGFTDSDNLKYVIESVISPAQLREPDARTLLISTPPFEGQDHYFCTKSDELALVGSYIKLTIDQSDLPKEAIDQFVQDLGGRQTITFRREGLCERIVDTEKAIVPEFQENVHVCVTPRSEYFPYYTKYAGLDSGVRDKTVLLYAYYDFKRAKVVVEGEAGLQGSQVTTANIFSHADKLEKDLNYGASIRRIADNDNLILIQDLSSLGKHWHPTDKDSLEAMVNELRLWFGRNAIEIHPSCRLLIGTLRSALWNKHRTEFSRTTLYGHADALSALMYLVRNVNQSHNPIPVDYGVDYSNQFFPKGIDHSSAAARALKRGLEFKGT